ncbi:unnamed protein product [Schistosoma rodhaini]|uniref:GATA-type domain-containing protein n=2 Tax=Schistosoma rodhaini TaxID=6188 RepID=A0AA85G5B7_9TREM|nr:unnamed protein product [Schistosoma rodhaini]CAH8598813.1 unnamed protein product [Schistosoma rodhaini]
MPKHQTVCRRRTLSFADITECRKINRTNLNENYDIDSSKLFVRSMVRHPSFTLLEDYQNSFHELPFLTLKDSNSQFKNTCESTEMNDSLKPNSNSQPVLDPFIFGVSFTESNSSNSQLDALQLSKMHSNSLGSTNSSPLENKEYLFPSSPLSSTLIKLYLSKVSLCSPTETTGDNLNSDNEQLNFHNNLYPNLIGLPGSLQTVLHSLASMVMPTRHFIGMKTTTNEIKSSNLTRLSSLNENFKIYHLKSHYSDGSAYNTDENYSSCTESSSILDDISNGYYSDNYLIEAAKKMKKSHMINNLWQTVKYNQQSSQISLFSDGHSKLTSAYIHHVNHHHHGKCHHKLGLTNVYAGLKSNKFGDTSTVSLSPSQSHNNNHKPCLKSKNVVSNNDNNNTTTTGIEPISQDIKSYNPLECFYNLWTNFNSKVIEDNFYYMDEKSLERRVRAQASNIISPVSF